MSSIGEIGLPGRIALVPSQGLAAKVAQLRHQGKHIPDEAELIAGINKLNVHGGVPATRDQKWLRLYAHRHVLGLGASSRGDAWMMAFVAPLTLSDYDRMARGMLRIRAHGGWFYQPRLPQVPPDCRTFKREIDEAWRQLPPPDRDPTLKPTRPPHHDELCDALDDVVGAARQIEVETRQDTPPIPYFAVESTTGQRQSTAAGYVFRLARAIRVAGGTSVEVRGVPDLLGSVREQDGDRLTVGFTGSVDRARIPPQGELVMSPNDRIQRIQQEAVERLRSGRTLSPWLLPMLADQALPAMAPGAAPTTAIPSPELDPGQAEAFRRALQRPELLLVHGPPGTGKTRTIGEIARACVARGERVLVCSQTNVAVDNVVERLPDEVLAVRVGSEDRVAASVQHRMVPSLAESIRKRILARTAPTMDLLEPWRGEHGLPATLLGRLVGAVDSAQRAERDHARRANELSAALAAVEESHAPACRVAETAARDASTVHSKCQERIAHATATHARAVARQSGWWGFLYRRRARTTAARLTRARDNLRAAAQELDRAQRAQAEAVQALATARVQDPTVREARARVDAAEGAVRQVIAGAMQVASALRGHVARERVTAPSAELPSLARFRDECLQVRDRLAHRAALLHEWRQQLVQVDENLHPELIRYADVVGSTCIGVGVRRNRIADEEFDVAIVDEAGQISLPATLVPLVRARRAILVGDPQQLPPFVDDEVVGYLEHYPSRRDPTVLKDLLTTSTFERLYRTAGKRHTVLLTHQRRMPKVVADFVSSYFYEGRLSTRVSRTPPGSLFTGCLAVVDTSDQGDRRERKRPRSESWQVPGYDNPAEAGLLIDLVQWCLRTDLTWGVIVPYRAQVQLLRTRLEGMVGDAQMVSDNLGTVDAFQGGERDVILFGFTRSNPTGQVGFLAELRRINVAITRARRQLVLIGDFTTLRAAHNRRLADVAKALYAHARRGGDLYPSLAIRTRVRQLEPGQT